MFVYNFCTFYTNYLNVNNTLTEECSYYNNNSSIEHVFYEQKLCEEWSARNLWDNAEIVFTQRNNLFNGDILSNNGKWFVYQTTYDKITGMDTKIHAFFIFMLFEFYKEHKDKSITVKELFDYFDGSGISKEFIIDEFNKYNILLDNTIIPESLLALINIKNKIELNMKKIIEEHLDMRPEYFYIILKSSNGKFYKTDIYKVENKVDEYNCIRKVKHQKEFYTIFKNNNKFMFECTAKKCFKKKVSPEKQPFITFFSYSKCYLKYLRYSEIYYDKCFCGKIRHPLFSAQISVNENLI